jgi:hypothetical protein
MILLDPSTGKCTEVPFIAFEILLESLINADVSGLYLVQISGLWGSSLLFHNYYTSLPTAADSYTKLQQSHSAAHTSRLV